MGFGLLPFLRLRTMRYIYWTKNRRFHVREFLADLKKEGFDPDHTVVHVDVDQDPETKDVVAVKFRCSGDLARDPLIPIDMCVKGRAYHFAARNFTFGVFNGVDGFIGLRTKWAERYLFTEFHHDQGAPFGTVAYIKDAGIDLPPEILPQEELYDGKESSENKALFDWLVANTPKKPDEPPTE